MFQPEDASNNIVDTEMQSVATELHSEQLEFSEKIEADDEHPFVVDDSFDRTFDSNTSPREITIEFLDSRNGEKFDRLVRDIKILAPFKRRLSLSSRSNSPNSSAVFMEDEHEIGAEAFPEAPTINQNDRLECSTIIHSPTTIAIAHAESEPEQNYHRDEEVAGAASINEYTPFENSIMNSSTTAAIIAHIKRRRYNADPETRADVLARRQKQIDYGKNTIGYENYIKLIPRNKRSKDHPQTPPKEVKYSRRAFDGLVRLWRTKLHNFDPPNDSSETSENHGDCASN